MEEISIPEEVKSWAEGAYARTICSVLNVTALSYHWTYDVCRETDVQDGLYLEESYTYNLYRMSSKVAEQVARLEKCIVSARKFLSGDKFLFCSENAFREIFAPLMGQEEKTELSDAFEESIELLMGLHNAWLDPFKLLQWEGQEGYDTSSKEILINLQDCLREISKQFANYKLIRAMITAHNGERQEVTVEKIVEQERELVGAQ